MLPCAGPHGGPTFGTWVAPHLEAGEVVTLEVGMAVEAAEPAAIHASLHATTHSALHAALGRL